MNPVPANRTSLVKMIFLTGVFFVLLGIMFQLDIPTVQAIGDSINTYIIERQLILQNPREEDAVKQGWIYYNLGRYELAGRLMEKEYKKDRNISALYCLGLIDLQHRRYEEGLVRLETVAAESPKHIPTRMVLGRAYYELRYYIKARQSFDTAVKIEPTNEQARLWLGKTYLQLNEPELARSMLETVTHGREAVEAAALIKPK